MNWCNLVKQSFALSFFIASYVFVVPIQATQSQAPLTTHLLSYFDHLIKHNILHVQNLEYMIKNADVVNPIFQSEADADHEVFVHWKQINQLLVRNSNDIEIAPIHAWAQKNLELLENHHRVKEEVRRETQDIYRPMTFVPLPAGTYTSSLDGQEFIIEPGTEIQDTPVTQWHWVQVMGYNPVARSNETGFQEIIINGKTIFLQPDHPVHYVSYIQVKRYIESIDPTRDSEYEYFLPSANEYEVIMKEALGPNWLQRIAKIAAKDSLAHAVTDIPFIEYNKQRMWGFIQHVWQYTRDKIPCASNVPIVLVFGLPWEAQELPTALESFLRPFNVNWSNRDIGFRLARRKKGISSRANQDSIPVNWKKAQADELKKWISQSAKNPAQPSSMIYPLSSAIWFNDLELVELLLRCGASPHEQESDLLPSALIFAVTKGRPDSLKLLIDYGGSPHEKNEFSMTPLHQLARLHMLEIQHLTDVVEVLTKHGADINAQDVYGITPLMYAVKNGDEELILVVLRYGADVNISDNSGRTALMYACNRKNSKAIISLLLENKADINRVDRFGDTALHILANGYDMDMAVGIKLLLDAQVAANAKNSSGDTALHILIKNDYLRFEPVKLLLDAGAAIDIEDHKGLTVFDYALRTLQLWNRPILDLLIAHKQQKITN
jgi:ankyrin repeat protein